MEIPPDFCLLLGIEKRKNIDFFIIMFPAYNMHVILIQGNINNSNAILPLISTIVDIHVDIVRYK